MGNEQTEPDDERLSIPLDPEAALRGLLKVDPEPEKGGKEARLAHIRKATREELAISKYRDGMIQQAREADATWDEINEALNTPR